MHKLPKLLLLVVASFTTILVIAQTSADKNDTQGFMRSNGKIYVVAAIVITILVGLIIYVMRLDRKISRLEKEK
jgi:hypothetical protein